MIFRQDAPETTEFTGEVEQTRQLLDRWNRNVGSDGRKLEEHMPRIVELAETYFTSQMTQLFPEKAEKYKRENYKPIRILSESEFIKDNLACGGVGPIAPASTDPLSNDVTFTAGRIVKNVNAKQDLVKSTFYGMLHELFHRASPRIEGSGGLYTSAFRERVVFRKGLKVYLENVQDPECEVTSWEELDETVIDHGTAHLAAKVGVSNRESGYRQGVALYQTQIIDQLFGGRFETLLGHHQDSDMDGFLAAVGAKVRPNLPYEHQAGVGSQILTRLIDGIYSR